MSGEFFEYDPVTGTRIDTEQDGEITVVRRSQNVSALIDKIRADKERNDIGIKQSMWKVASVPLVVELELMQKGIRLNRLSDPGEYRRFMRELKSNYPYLLTTDRRVI